MANIHRSDALYRHPFSKNYWRDAASEMKSVKMLVITALLVALRIALKPLAIPLGPQLKIQTAMLATALGAMVYGPVVAVPAALISDTLGFLINPEGNYFFPYVLTEISSTFIYALCLYRQKPTATRVMISRFVICFLVNVVMQTGIQSWAYAWFGYPEKAKDQLLGMFTLARIFKNLCMFPIESVVLTLFLKLLVPVTRRARLTFAGAEEMHFSRRQIVALCLLTVLGAGSATGYLAYRYQGTSRSADYSDKTRVEMNQEMTWFVLEQEVLSEEGQTMIGIVDSAYRPLFTRETDYTVTVYVLDPDAFRKGQAADESYSLDTLWLYSKSGPKNDPYQSLIPVGTAKFRRNEKTGEIFNYTFSLTSGKTPAPEK